MTGTPLHIVVGLGNPGAEYRATRHNAGFWFVDALARAGRAEFRPQSRYHGELAKVSIGGRELVLLKPQTFMNRSGQSVRALCDYMKTPIGQVLVAHDELDLPVGTARFKLGGGHGGHNGLRDIISHCGADFWRLRLGIAHPGDRSQVIDYVLQRPSAADEQQINAGIAAGSAALATLLRDGSERAMKELHTGQG